MKQPSDASQGCVKVGGWGGRGGGGGRRGAGRRTRGRPRCGARASGGAGPRPGCGRRRAPPGRCPSGRPIGPPAGRRRGPSAAGSQWADYKRQILLGAPKDVVAAAVATARGGDGLPEEAPHARGSARRERLCGEPGGYAGPEWGPRTHRDGGTAPTNSCWSGGQPGPIARPVRKEQRMRVAGYVRDSTERQAHRPGARRCPGSSPLPVARRAPALRSAGSSRSSTPIGRGSPRPPR